MTETIDEQDGLEAYKPFPTKKYIESTIPVLCDEGEPIVFIPKSRSMMASWTVAGTAAWLAQQKQAVGVVIQSKDEDKAKKLVFYARTLYSRSHPEWQKRHPLKKNLSAQPETEIRWANDSWIMAITGTAAKIRSEHPTIVIFDEAAFMDAFDECFNVARGAKPPHVWALSSAEKGPFFDALENAYPCNWRQSWTKGRTGSLDEFLSADVERPCPGLTFGRTEKGWAVIHMHFSADPIRDKNWEILERSTYLSDADFDKEQNINPYAKDGSLIYPEFDQRVHVIPHEEIPKIMTRYAAGDPHPRTPHFWLWMGVDKWGDHYYYRELWPSVVYAQPRVLKDTDQENRWKIRDYVDYIAKLEGNSIEWKGRDTDRESGKYVQQDGGEIIVDRYLDQAGKGFGKDPNNPNEMSYWGTYTNLGLSLTEPKKAHVAGEDAIHAGFAKRFHDKKGNWPRIHISARCRELILEFKRLRYPVSRQNLNVNELPQEGVEARRHGVDLVRYLETAPLVYSHRLESKEHG